MTDKPPARIEPEDPVKALEAEHVLTTYARVPVVFERGDGARLWDQQGRRYLDLVSGIGVASMGHANPALARAIGDQAAALVHTSNLYYHPLQGQVASRLARLSGLPRAFFCNSGTEAVEACLKFARRFWHTSGKTERTGFVALEGAFHGRTFGSLSVTWDDHYRRPFMPLLDGVTFVPPADPESLRRAVTDRTAAVIVEAIQGEGGVRPLGRDFAAAIRDVQAATGVLLIADEVQCGLGRTGEPFAIRTLGLEPDLMAIGKALGGGVPVGAALVSEQVAASISKGDHGTTYGGNLLACRAAMVFLDELVDGGLLEHLRTVGRRLGEGLEQLAARHKVVKEVRGAGLMWGLELTVDASPFVEEALAQGVLINRTATRVIRLLPPFVITASEVDEALAALDIILASHSPEVAS
jgi:acetylornithine/N-succinyldiaminopimelate aminotransferase